MKFIGLFCFIAVLGMSNFAGAQEWVPFEGEIPENAVMPTDENKNAGPICRMTGPREVSPAHLLGSVQRVEGELVCRGATYSALKYRPAGGKVLIADAKFDILIEIDEQEWVPFEGEIPENAVMPTTKNRFAGVICRMTGPREVSPAHLLGSVQRVEGELVCRGATYSARKYRPAGDEEELADDDDEENGFSRGEMETGGWNLSKKSSDGQKARKGSKKKYSNRANDEEEEEIAEEEEIEEEATESVIIADSEFDILVTVTKVEEEEEIEEEETEEREFAQQWMPYEGEVPENAIWTSPNARPPHPICRKNGRPNGWIGWMDEEEGICHTMGRSASDDNRPIRIVDWTADNQRRAYRSDRGGWTEYKPLRNAGSFEIMLAPDQGYVTWVSYKGEVPENALWTAPRKLPPHPICRMHKQGNGWIGWMDEETGVCYTMGFNASNDRKRKIVSWTTDDTNKDGQGFEILVGMAGSPDEDIDEDETEEEEIAEEEEEEEIAEEEEEELEDGEDEESGISRGEMETGGWNLSKKSSEGKKTRKGSKKKYGNRPNDEEEEEAIEEEAYVFIGCNYWGHGRTGANGEQNVTWDVCHDAAIDGDYEWFGLNWGDHVEEGKGGCHVSNARLPKVLQGNQCKEVTDEEGHFLGRSQSMAIYRKQN